MIDLHFHSTYSDGKFSVEQIGELVLKNNLKYFSLTDHDTVKGLEQLQKVLGNSGCTLIPGVELTCLYEEQEIHILAYDFNVHELQGVLDERHRMVESQKIEEMREAIQLWTKLGYEVDAKLVHVKDKPIGYTVGKHIYSNAKNIELMEKSFGKILNYSEFYEKFQQKGTPCYTERSGVDIHWIMKNIRPYVADMIVAHPFVPVSFFVKPLSFETMEILLSYGIDGFEVYHDRTAEEKIAELKTFVENRNLKFTGGSDCHGRIHDTKIGHYASDKPIPAFNLTNFTYTL